MIKMKKSIIAAVIVVAAAIAGVTAYEVATANSTETTVTTDNVKPATSSAKSNATESSITASSTTISSGTTSSVKSKSSENTETNTAVTNTSSKNQEVKPTATTKVTSVSSNNNENTESPVTTSSTKTSKTIEPTTSSSNNAESSRTSTKSSTASTGATSSSSTTSTGVTSDSSTSTGTTSSSSTSTNNMINGEPVLFNSNSQVSSYYGTWTVGNKVGGAVIGNGESVTPPTGDNIIITKSLYSFDGTVIENPDYYIISTSASTYFGSAGWTGNIGATSNGVIKFIIAVPSDVKVTSSTIYRYEKENKIIINDGNLVVLDSSQTAYSASLE